MSKRTPHFRLQPIVDITATPSVHGLELLAGYKQCPQWTHAKWITWYQSFDTLLYANIPKHIPTFINVNSFQMCDPHIVAAINNLIQRRTCVIEWTEDIATEHILRQAIFQLQEWKRQGALIAIDDIGAGQDGIGRTLHIMPHYVKIDRHVLEKSKQIQTAFLHKLRDTLSHIGCRVILEGIETEDDLLIAKESGFQYVQGFLYPNWHIRVDTLQMRCQKNIFAQQ